MIGFHFTEFNPKKDERTPFEQLLDLFLELMVYTSGDVEETFDWMEQIDKEHGITTPEYTLDDFRRDLEKQSYVKTEGGQQKLGGKGEKLIRQRSLDQIFGKMKRSDTGNHRTPNSGSGDEQTSDRRSYRFGDQVNQIDFTASIRNSQIRGGVDQFN